MTDIKFQVSTDQDPGELRAVVTIPADPLQPVFVDPEATIEQLRTAIIQMGGVCRVIPKNNDVHRRLLDALTAVLPYLPATQQDALRRPMATPAVYCAPITEAQRLRNVADALDKRDQVIEELRAIMRQCGINAAHNVDRRGPYA